MRARTAVYVLLAILALIAPWLGLYPVFLMKLLCFAMFACAFNLLLGYTKMLSFGHAAYFGSSAYITGWLVAVHGWGTLEGISAGVAVAMLLGLVIGAIAVRRQGI
jgi:branched-chain amino acid transport system permease protein